MLKRLYDWTLSRAGHRRAESWLFGISFIESSVFPIPPDVLLLPMCLAHPARSWRFAAIATVASVLGGLAGYAIGYLLFETVGRPIIDFYGYGQAFADFQGKFAQWGGLSVFVFGLTPLPFKVITLASGVAGLSLPVFLVAALLARAARFFAVAALLWRYGAPIKTFIDRRFNLLATIFTLLLIGGFLAIRYLD